MILVRQPGQSRPPPPARRRRRHRGGGQAAPPGAGGGEVLDGRRAPARPTPATLFTATTRSPTSTAGTLRRAGQLLRVAADGVEQGGATAGPVRGHGRGRERQPSGDRHRRPQSPRPSCSPLCGATVRCLSSRLAGRRRRATSRAAQNRGLCGVPASVVGHRRRGVSGSRPRRRRGRQVRRSSGRRLRRHPLEARDSSVGVRRDRGGRAPRSWGAGPGCGTPARSWTTPRPPAPWSSDSAPSGG